LGQAARTAPASPRHVAHGERSGDRCFEGVGASSRRKPLSDGSKSLVCRLRRFALSGLRHSKERSRPMPASPEKPVAIVTGGGRGMGAAIARELARQGYALALTSPSDSCETLAGELGAVARRGRTEIADDVKGIVDLALESYGRIDAVVNFAGHPPKGDLLDISDENWALGNDMMVMSV